MRGRNTEGMANREGKQEVGGIQARPRRSVWVQGQQHQQQHAQNAAGSTTSSWVSPPTAAFVDICLLLISQGFGRLRSIFKLITEQCLFFLTNVSQKALQT